MARRLLVVPLFVFFFSAPAGAQRWMDAFAGYSYQGLYRLPNAIPGRNLNGVEISVQYKFKDWLGVVGQVDGHYGLPSGPSVASLNILVGPQISRPYHAYSPFAHVLVGYGHAYTNGIWDNSFATSIGGGVDMRLRPLLSWRMFECDDVITHYFGGYEHNPRITTGIILRF